MPVQKRVDVNERNEERKGKEKAVGFAAFSSVHARIRLRRLRADHLGVRTVTLQRPS